MRNVADPYAPHAAYIRQAQLAPELWRVVAMLVGFEVVFSLSPVVFAFLMPGESLTNQFLEGVTAFGTLAQFGSFGLVAIGFLVLLQLLHGRGFLSLVGPADIALSDLWRVGLGVGLWLLVLDALPILSFLSGEEGSPEMRSLGIWLMLVPVTVLVVLVQVSTEELFFRGYLQQQLALLSDNRLLWMGLPSILFGALHYWNGNGAVEGITWAIWAACLGVACADLTARTGTIGAAIGLHLANNAFALLLVGIEGWPSSGVALFVYPYQDPSDLAQDAAAMLQPDNLLQLLVMLMILLIMWLAARIALRR